MMLEQVRTLTHQLRLFGMHEACERRAQAAMAQQQHPLEFLRLILEDERLARQDRTAKALATKARFRFRADLEDWDVHFHKDLPKAKLSELGTLSFFHNRENLLLVGKTGMGKTHLAIALGHRLCQHGHATVFLPVNFLFEEIQAAKAAGRYLSYIRSLIKANVLILDDLGLRTYTHEEATALLDILEERYQKAPVIVTSQVEPQGWLKLFEDPVIAEAIVDRLIHPAQKVTLKADRSYREHMKENKSGLKKAEEACKKPSSLRSD
jgi:DNA replication protein DnaC